MSRYRCLVAGALCVAAIPLLDGCAQLLDPCYDRNSANPIANPSLIAGHWKLVSIDGNALPYTIPLTAQFNPGGAIRAYGGGIKFDEHERYFTNDCNEVRAEKGVATASYRYEEGGAIKPRGNYSGTFDFDRKQNTLVLAAAGHAAPGTVTRDANGNPTRITTSAKVSKWGASLTFILVFERTTDFAKTDIAVPD